MAVAPGTYAAPLLFRTYDAGSYRRLIASFEADAQQLAASGYELVGQHYVEGEWGCAYGALALILTPFLIGIVLWIQILTTRPTGTLTATYRYRGLAR